MNFNAKWFIIFILAGACVERINFSIPPAQFQTVVEGMISDNPEPYTIKVSKSLNLDSDLPTLTAVENAAIKLFDDIGNVESFEEIMPGEYRTNGIIQGQVGRSYHIRIETDDGKIFESEPEKINPVGELEEIRYEFEARTIEKSYGKVAANVFNIYIDANAGDGDENYVRWKYKGTYKVVTHPELHMVVSTTYTPYADPYPCSGYIIVPALGGGRLEKIAECTCCICWANHFESTPHLSDQQLISNSQFKNVKIAEVPITSATFYDKYLVEVEQMSLSRKVFEFFKLVRAQKEGASSLFQPPSGEIRGNVHSVNSNEPVIGLFWATAIKKQSLFIERSEVPYNLTPIEVISEPCNNFYPNASTTKPIDWF